MEFTFGFIAIFCCFVSYKMIKKADETISLNSKNLKDYRQLVGSAYLYGFAGLWFAIARILYS